MYYINVVNKKLCSTYSVDIKNTITETLLFSLVATVLRMTCLYKEQKDVYLQHKNRLIDNLTTYTSTERERERKLYTTDASYDSRNITSTVFESWT